MPLLTGKAHTTDSGEIYYRVNTLFPDRLTLVFLHGLTVDGRMFAPQARAFHENYNLLIWDAPAHGHSMGGYIAQCFMEKYPGHSLQTAHGAMPQPATGSGSSEESSPLTARKTFAGFPVRWIKDAGHCSGLDAPEAVNAVISTFLSGIESNHETAVKTF